MPFRYCPAALAALGLLLLSGCSGGGFAVDDLIPSFSASTGPTAPSSRVSVLWQDDAIVTVRGVLTGTSSEPHECMRLRISQTESYALVGDTRGVPEGTPVQVTGALARWSSCDTFKVVRIDSIRPIAP